MRSLPISLAHALAKTACRIALHRLSLALSFCCLFAQATVRASTVRHMVNLFPLICREKDGPTLKRALNKKKANRQARKPALGQLPVREHNW